MSRFPYIKSGGNIRIDPDVFDDLLEPHENAWANELWDVLGATGTGLGFTNSEKRRIMAAIFTNHTAFITACERVIKEGP